MCNCRGQRSLISIKSGSLSARTAGQRGCNCNAQKAAKWICCRFNNGNGTAIIRWRWLADPQAGVRGCNNGQPKGVLLVDMAVGQVVYGEEVTQKGTQGRVVGGVLAMVRRMRRRTVRDCSLASRRPAVATGSFASRQIAALFHLRLAILFGRNKLQCPELESLTNRIFEVVLVP